jgi:predicted aspartyl protease
MKTLLLAATALIGVAAAQPAHAAGRYTVDDCSPNSVNPNDAWTLGFDSKLGVAEFWKNSDHDATLRWGPYTVAGYRVDASVGDKAAPMTLTMVTGRNDAFLTLTWTAANGNTGTMQCRNIQDSDLTPARWHEFPPTVYDPQVKPAAAPDSAAVPTAKDPQVKPASLPLTFSGGGVLTAISLGSQPVIMLVDTGANTMSISESVANTLLANHEATEAAAMPITFADGTTKSERQIVINTVTVAGRALHKVRAGVEADNAVMLLSLDVLSQVGSKFSIDIANAKLTFDTPAPVAATATAAAAPVTPSGLY